MYEFSQPKEIEKIHVRVRLNPDKDTLFSNITVEIGLTSDSLNVFSSYLEPAAKPRSLVTFTNSSGIPMEGKFVKISGANKSLMIIAEIAIIEK